MTEAKSLIEMELMKKGINTLELHDIIVKAMEELRKKKIEMWTTRRVTAERFEVIKWSDIEQVLGK